MHAFGDHRGGPHLRELVVEASLALARLDAERLEQLALSCQALNRDVAAPGDVRHDLKRQAGEALGEMAVFGRVLDATRANLEVMNRLRERRRGSREYPEPLGRGSAGPWALAEK